MAGKTANRVGRALSILASAPGVLALACVATFLVPRTAVPGLSRRP